MKALLVRAALVIALCGAAAARAQEVVDLPTRAGVTQRILVLAPQEPAAVAVLLPGGAGNVGVRADGRPERGNNFLVRSRQRFVQHGLAAIVVDVPSDRTGLEGTFRESREHAQDLAAVVRWARDRFGKRVWLVGTSRGTHSAAEAARTLQAADAPDGIVLSSTIVSRVQRGPRAGPATPRPVTELDLTRVALPVLVVHHEQDPCPSCDPAMLPALMKVLPAGRSELLTFTGGPSEGAACEPWSHHGFNGIEDRVVSDIAAWIRARP